MMPRLAIGKNIPIHMNTSPETACKEARAFESTDHARILVVDDDEGLRQLNRTALSLSGYEVDSAEDGQSAWDALQANHYDLLITDNNMPRLSGLELIRKLRTMHMTLPIILASGSLRLATPDDGRLPAVTMLPKPYGMNELLEAVKNTLPAAAKTTAADEQKPVSVEFTKEKTFPVAPGKAGTFTVERYTAERKRGMGQGTFYTEAKNATFAFLSGIHMDYHSDRFIDPSLMIFTGSALVAVLPANLNANGTLISHEGLTYGGLVVARAAYSLWMMCWPVFM